MDIHSCPSLTVLWIDYCWFNYKPGRTPIASRLSNSLVDINQIICCSLIATPVSIEYRFVVTLRQLADSIYVAILSYCNQLHACRNCRNCRWTNGFQWNLPVMNSTKPVTLDLYARLQLCRIAVCWNCIHLWLYSIHHCRLSHIQ